MRCTHGHQYTTAYHESGHVVVAHHFAAMLIGVNIRMMEAQRGETIYSLTGDQPPEERIAIILSGPIAQARVAANINAVSDRIDASRLALQDRTKPEAYVLLAKATQLAAKPLDARWSDVVNIAEILFRQKQLNGLQLAALLGDTDAAEILEDQQHYRRRKKAPR